MKIKSTILNFCLLVFAIFNVNSVIGQCENKIEHISGTVMVQNINVTVNRAGLTTTTSNSCFATQPYTIGRNQNSNNGLGSYIFNFSPAVDSLSLNFSAISNSTLHKEIVSIFINGVHHPVTGSTEDGFCGRSAAIVTDMGNITGAEDGSSSAWEDLIIAGPIESITVQDSIAFGSPNGVSFEISICAETATSTSEIENSQFNLFPNPANNLLTLSGLNQNEVKYYISDILGKVILMETVSHSDTLEIDVSEFQSGIYIVFLERNGRIEKRKVVIE